MLSNYIKIALRHLWHNKLYSSINIIGLAIGITAVLLAVMYIKDEGSFDEFHEKKLQLYRITTTSYDNKGEKHIEGGTGQVQGPAFKAAVPEILDYSRLMGGDIYGTVIANNKALSLQLLFADESFFNIFSFKLLRGNASTVLKNVDAAVITESTAKKFFNGIDVVGKWLKTDADPSAMKLGKPLVITGVVQDPPKNSSIRFDVLFTMKFMQLSFDDNNWLNSYLGTFVLLHPGANIKAVTEKFNKVYAVYAKEQVSENKKSYGYDPKISYGLQHITDMHLNPLFSGPGGREGGIVNNSSPFFSYLFLGIASFILLMAGINFINISIAGSLKRAKEVGVRKITGGSKSQIIFQFLLESVLLCAMAFALSIALMNTCLPIFNQLAGKQMLLHEVFDRQLMFLFVIVFTVIVLFTGLYPAFVLSGFKPTEVLYNKQKLAGRNIFGRALVVVQFSLAVFFAIATLIYYQQMDYIRTKDLGYNPHQVIRTSIPGDRVLKPIYTFFRNELSKEPAIKQISFGFHGGNKEPVKIGDKTIEAVHSIIDEYHLQTLEIPLKAGRNFSADFPADKSKSVIVNEAFVKAAGLSNPIGTQLRTSDYYDKETKTIVGVVRDFHSGSLRERIQPMVMLMSEWAGGGIWIKVEKNKQKDAIAALEKVYKRAMPTAIFQYSFVDELNARAYLQEQRWQKIAGIATILSIIICCLGLLGLSHLAAQQRIKEIGIRKVLGASVAGIASLLSKDFVKLVIIAFAIASPFAWWVMNNWLQDFAYRINISWSVFVIAGTGALLIALLTVSFQAIKAAVANPVSSLRSE
jgi:putative ABC transport system permease protein